MNAQQVVENARQNPCKWQGDGKHSNRVIYADEAFSVGEHFEHVQSFWTGVHAALALAHLWRLEDKEHD